MRPGEESPRARAARPADSAALDRLGEALFRRWGRLDALVGNAGLLGVLSPLHHVDPKDWDDVLAVNVTANWRLIRSLDPLLRCSAAGRVAFITSSAASRADMRAYWGPYAMSKAGLDTDRPDLRGGDPQHVERPGHAGQSRPVAHADAGQGHAGRGSGDLRTPQDLAPRIVEICSPEWTETGKLYDFPTI